jgi:hypothetical protein
MQNVRGDAYLIVEDQKDVDRLFELHRQKIENRYVEACKLHTMLHTRIMTGAYDLQVFEARWEEYLEDKYYVEHKLEYDMNYASALIVEGAQMKLNDTVRENCSLRCLSAGLPQDVTEEELIAHFDKFGVVEGHVHVLVDDKRRPTGAALILIEREARANLAYHARKVLRALDLFVTV